MAISGGKILALGMSVDIQELADDHTQIINLESRMVMPGLILINDDGNIVDTVTSLTPVALVQSDKDGFVTFANEAFLQIHGREREEMLRDGWANAIHLDDFERLKTDWSHCIKTGDPMSIEYRIIQPSGRVVHVFKQTVSVRDSNGEVTSHIGTLTDVTAQKDPE